MTKSNRVHGSSSPGLGSAEPGSFEHLRANRGAMGPGRHSLADFYGTTLHSPEQLRKSASTALDEIDASIDKDIVSDAWSEVLTDLAPHGESEVRQSFPRSAPSVEQR